MTDFTLVRFRVDGNQVFLEDCNLQKHRADTPEELMRALRAIQEETGEASTGPAPPGPSESWWETFAQQAETTVNDAYGPLFGRFAGHMARNGRGFMHKLGRRKVIRRR